MYSLQHYFEIYPIRGEGGGFGWGGVEGWGEKAYNCN